MTTRLLRQGIKTLRFIETQKKKIIKRVPSAKKKRKSTKKKA